MTCDRSDCDRDAVFAVHDLRIESTSVGGPTSFVADRGAPGSVCSEHLAEYLALGCDGDSELVVMVVPLDLGACHLLAEGFPDDVSYEGDQ